MVGKFREMISRVTANEKFQTLNFDFDALILCCLFLQIPPDFSLHKSKDVPRNYWNIQLLKVCHSDSGSGGRSSIPNNQEGLSSWKPQLRSSQSLDQSNLQTFGRSTKNCQLLSLLCHLCSDGQCSVVSDFLGPVDCSPPGSSVHGISQARILEWGAISFSKGSSWPRDWTCVSYSPALAGGFCTISTTWEAYISTLKK